MHKTLTFITALIATLLTFFSHAQDSPPDGLANDAISLKSVNQQVEALVQTHKLPSLAYSIVEGDEVTYYQLSADSELNQSTSSYRIASISKMVVGIAVMQLVESGQLSLNDKLSDLLPTLSFENKWEATHPLTLLHVVESTTGWDEIPLEAFAFRNEPKLPLAQALSLFPNHRASRWPPGTRHAYTNVAAAVAALVVENVTKMPFEKYAQQYIFAPLNISSADYSNFPKDVSSGYSVTQKAIDYKPILLSHAGGLSIRLQDLTVILQAMNNRSSVLLSADSYERIEHSFGTNVGKFEAGYGVFNYARYYQGERFRGHDGAFPGWRAELSYSPKHNIGFVVLQNSENDRAFRAIVKVISDYLLSKSAKDVRLESVSDEERSQLNGYYRYHNPRNQKRYFLERLVASYSLRVDGSNARLSSVIPPGWVRELQYVGNGRWQNDKGEVVMIEAQDPILGEVMHYGDRVFKRESAMSALVDKCIAVLWLLLLLVGLPITIVWMIKLARGRMAEQADRRIRKATMYAVANAWAFLLLLVFGMMAPIERLGAPNAISLSLLLLSLGLVVTTVFAGWQTAKNISTTRGRFTNLYVCTYLFVQVLVVGYLVWFGAIGIQTWS